MAVVVVEFMVRTLVLQLDSPKAAVLAVAERNQVMALQEMELLGKVIKAALKQNPHQILEVEVEALEQ
jgi:hypothetical protein